MRPPVPGTRSKTAAACWAGLVLLTGCAEGVGGVELSWGFFDRDVHTVYPRGDHADACALSGRAGAQAVAYGLNVRLMVLDACDEGGSLATCDLLAERTFDCDRFRGLIPELPSSDVPYLMHVEARVTPDTGEPFAALPDCIATPGPRLRTVRPGRITDLAVYQFVIDATAFDGTGDLDRRLDTEACRP